MRCGKIKFPEEITLEQIKKLIEKGKGGEEELQQGHQAGVADLVRGGEAMASNVVL